ncbi:hypothetical protein NNA36_18270 [Shimia sp. CNT1-13L.2]|uniref:hypothetical protein n=1 Tax=Shimia sp. CNT1-13L.2 TaxID=2959663 RepID=UPI0020CD61B3|nr:hypothetical protein [Shimia sp. CNT1-13L.2]MCP9483914.1 hypothetical protein [Shimia sp. CNT1-13L.2]
MEYIISPVIFFLLLRFAFPAVITWFFERFVEPKADMARKQERTDIIPPTKVSNVQMIKATRNGLDEHKNSLKKKEH